MASGISTTDEVRKAYKDVSDRKYSAVIVGLRKVDGADQMEVFKTFPPSAGDPEKEWAVMIEDMTEEQPRYIICDFQVKETELVTKSKLCLISFVSENAAVRLRMIYASTFVELGNQLDPPKTVQTTELSELKYEALKTTVFQK